MTVRDPLSGMVETHMYIQCRLYSDWVVKFVSKCGNVVRQEILRKLM